MAAIWGVLNIATGFPGLNYFRFARRLSSLRRIISSNRWRTFSESVPVWRDESDFVAPSCLRGYLEFMVLGVQEHPDAWNAQ